MNVMKHAAKPWKFFKKARIREFFYLQISCIQMHAKCTYNQWEKSLYTNIFGWILYVKLLKNAAKEQKNALKTKILPQNFSSKTHTQSRIEQ